MRQPEDTSILSGQQGQASVFVLAMLGVVLLITVFLYQSGRLTSEKMQIQNGADAAAFGASVLGARSLNFAAYTNRAMVANEVAVGQLVGLLSFADELKTSRKYAEIYARILDAIAALFPPAAGPIIAIAEGIETVGNVLGTVGDTLGRIFDKVIPPFIKVLSLINQTYSISQKIYQGATYALIFENINKSLQDNIVISEGGKGPVLSPLYGFITMLGHIPSSWSGFSRVYSADDDKKYKGMQRLAATVREARDPFSSGEKSDVNRDWHFNLVRNLGIVKFSYGADSVGGSELRATDKSYVWSAADGLVFGANLKVKFSIEVPLLPDIKIEESWGWNMPFGTGGYQASKDQKLQLTDILPSTPQSIYGPRKNEVYGGAGNSSHISAWPGIMAEMSSKNVDKYGGLHPYRDIVEEYKPSLPFSAPFFLVGVTKPLKDLKQQGPQHSNHYDLYEYVSSEDNDKAGKIRDSICAIAKSELYFAKPTKGKAEKQNIFSPYWQARLVETSNSERFFALAIQQETWWLTKKEIDLAGGLSKLTDLLTYFHKILDPPIEKLLSFLNWLFSKV